MGEETQALAIISMIRDKFNDDVRSNPRLAKQFEGFDRIICFELTDLDKIYHFKIEKRSAGKVIEGKPEYYDMYLKSKFSVFIDVMTGKIDPATAYITKKMIARGDLRDMAKLQKLVIAHAAEVRALLE